MRACVCVVAEQAQGNDSEDQTQKRVGFLKTSLKEVQPESITVIFGERNRTS